MPRETAPPTPVAPTRQLLAASPSADVADTATVDESSTVDESPSVDRSRAICEHLTLDLDGFVLEERTLVSSCMLSYLTMVTSLLERRQICREELLDLLRSSLRQRSIHRLARREYVLRYLQQHPP